MSQKTTANDELVLPKSIGVPLTKAESEKLSELAKRGKRSRQLEAMLRLHDRLKLFSMIPDGWTFPLEGQERNKKITVILMAIASPRLAEVAKKAKCTRLQESALRLHDHLRRVPEINGDYHEITTL